MSNIVRHHLRAIFGIFLIVSLLSIIVVAPITLGTGNTASAMVTPPEDDAPVATNSCEANGGEFSFALCPALRLANDGLELFDTEIRKRIQIDPAFYNGPPTPPPNADGTPSTAPANPLREVWGRLRNVAFILLIPIMLVLVIGTALGFSLLDAYTVRRAMPRLLFAVIFMTLSYDIGVIMIEVSNAAARGVQGLLAASVGGADNLNLEALFSPPQIDNVPGGDFTAIAAGGVLAGIAVSVGALSIGILTSFLLSAAGAFMLIFFALLARQLITVGILVALPLAILSWIFPGNDKIWKLVWGTFIAMLWLGPAFGAFIVLGRIGVFIVNAATIGSASGLIDSSIITASKLFILVASAAAGGWLLAKVNQTGLIGGAPDRTKGYFDKLKNRRVEDRKRLGESAKQGTRFNNTLFVGKGKVARKLSRGAAYTANSREGVRDIGTINPRTAMRRYNANMRNTMGNMEHDLSREYEEKNRDFAAIKGDDTKMRAARFSDRKRIEQSLIASDAKTYGGDQGKDARNAVAQQILKAQEGASMGTFQKARIKAMVASGTGYQDEEVVTDENGRVQYEHDDTGNLILDAKGNKVAQRQTVFRSDEMLEDINQAYGADRNGAGRAVGELKGLLAQSQQLAGNAGFGTVYGQLNAMYDAQGTEGYNAARATAHQKIMDDAAVSTSAYQAVSMQKPSGARELARAHAGRIQGAAERLEAAEDHERGLRESPTAVDPEQLRAAEVSVARFNDELDATTATAAQLLDTMGHSAPAAIADVFAQELMSRRVGGGQTTQQAVMLGTGELDPNTGREVMQPAPSVIQVGTEKSGKPIMGPNPAATTQVHATVRDLIEEREDRTRRNAQLNVGEERGEGAGMRDRKRLQPNYGSNAEIDRLNRGG